MMQNKWFKTALVALIGAMIISFAFLNMQNSAESTYQSPRAISGSSIGGGFSLIDEDGEVFTDQDLKRPYRLIYFGFTYCPAICPTELAKTVKAFNQLPEEIQENIDLVFITIDPERETPEVMKQ